MTLPNRSLPSLLQSTPTVEWCGGRRYIAPTLSMIQDGRPFTGNGPKAVAIFDQISSFLAGDQPAYPWQRRWAYEAMRKGPSGNWAARNAVLCAPRQNGKGNSIEERTIIGICFAGETNILHTSHNLEIAEEAFARMIKRIESNQFLKRLYLKSENTKGRKAIYFKDIKGKNKTGAVINYRTRSGKNGRGSGNDLIIIDEAMYFDHEQNASLRPTLTAKKSSQIIYTFTGLFPESDYLHDIRAKVLKAKEAGHELPGWTWLEWSADGVEDWEDQPEWWSIRCNPSSMDGMVTLETLMSHYTDMTATTYAQEHLNAHQYPANAQSLFTEQGLATIEDKDSKTGEVIYLGVHLAKNLSHCWITAASIRPDGKVHIELVASQKGKSWVIPRLTAMRDKHNITTPIVISEINAVGMMTLDFQKAGIPYINLSSREWIQACNNVVDLYEAGRLVHIGQPELTASLLGARLDDKGQGRMWSWKESLGELGPTVAVTHAIMGALKDAATPDKTILLPGESTGTTPRAYTQYSDLGGMTTW